MDILKKLLSNPAFDHLAENIISYMDTDEAMELIVSEVLSDEERKVVRKILRKLMFKEAQMRCEKEMTMVKFLFFQNEALQKVDRSWVGRITTTEKQWKSGKFQPIV